LRKEDQDPFAEAGTAEPFLPLAITAIAIEELAFVECKAILGDTGKFFKIKIPNRAPPHEWRKVRFSMTLWSHQDVLEIFEVTSLLNL
jgi:hypothetical protein